MDSRRLEILQKLKEKSTIKVVLGDNEKDWKLIWKYGEPVCIEAEGQSFYPNTHEQDRCLFIAQTPTQGEQKRIEFRLNTPLTGDLRHNTERWFYDDWELEGTFRLV